MSVVIGLDVGTSGARAMAFDADGHLVARHQVAFAHPPYVPAPGLAEQDAAEWWLAGAECLTKLSSDLAGQPVAAISVDSTSGTFVPVDVVGAPLHPALMYNDNRAKGLEAAVNEAAGDFCDRLGYAFPPAFALVKLAWIAKEQPELLARTAKFLHPADWLVGQLTGDFNVTDTSNALKSGVDLITGQWPDFIESKLGISHEKLPRIVRPGEQVGEVSKAAAARTGLKQGTPVIAGASDGTASFLASRASAVGDWNLTLGSTIAIRGVSRELVRDPQGRLYCHRHPEGWWLPGGASNCGGEALTKTFDVARLAELDTAAQTRLESAPLVYPLVRQGERMPFVSGTAEGFVLGKPADEADLYAGYLLGLALVTAWSVEEANVAGADVDGDFYLSGGGGKGLTLGRAMATALGRTLLRTEEAEAAMGVALLAAGWAWHSGSVSAAQRAMVRLEGSFEPYNKLQDFFTHRLEELKAECHRRGYL